VLRCVLPDEVAKHKVCFEALDALFSFEMWIRLRRDQQLSAAAARQVVHDGADALLAAADKCNTN
jgi:hypothetical protein